MLFTAIGNLFLLYDLKCDRITVDKKKGGVSMSEYRRLDFSKLNFSDDVITYEDAVKKATPFDFTNDIIFGQKKINVTKAKKDYDDKCVKLEIFC